MKINIKMKKSMAMMGIIMLSFLFAQTAYANKNTPKEQLLSSDSISSFYAKNKKTNINSNPFTMADKTHDESLRIAKGKMLEPSNLKSSQAVDEKKQADKDILSITGKRYIVKFKEDVPMEQIFNTVSLYNYRLIGKSERRTVMIKLNNIHDFEQQTTDIIDFIEEDKVKKTHAVPSDTYYSNQWAIPEVRLPQAWNIAKGTNTVFVAVIDSGVYRTQPDLLGVDIRSGWDYLFDDYCDWDSIGHGTNVAGIIGAETNNNQGIAGVNWDVAIVPLRVVYSDGTIYTADEITAIYDAADMGCDVINLSLGGSYYSAAEESAISYAISKGCIVVASAGNDGTSTYSYPASYNGVVSVGSLDSNLNYSYFSQYNDKVDVIAPGESILTTADWHHEVNGNDYTYVDGTSFSAPYVSGIAALAVACQPSVNSTEFNNILKVSCTDLGDPGYDNHYGYGLIDAEKILMAVAPVISVQSVSLSKSFITLLSGTSETLVATVFPLDATNKNVFWSSSNSSVATVDTNGRVTAIGTGSAVITATSQDANKTATCLVDVFIIPVQSVNLNKSNTIINFGNFETLTATIYPANATNKNLIWSSSSPNVAIVESNGKVTAVGTGTAAIIANSVDGGKTASCIVTVPSTYSVTYNGNGNTSGVVPFDSNAYLPASHVTVLDNTGSLIKTGFAFGGWNTKADGSGISYTPGTVFTIGPTNVTLYASWLYTQPIEDFVTRFYQLCLDRDPDDDGLNYWVDKLMSGEQTGADIAQGFIFSQEFIDKNFSDDAFLDVMYQAFFDRAADSIGMNYWLSQIADGKSRLYVLAQFVESSEFAGICNEYGITKGSVDLSDEQIIAFVTRFYWLCLDREPDTTGLNDWIDKLKSGELTGANLAQGFVFSNEFISKNFSNTEFISVMYRVFFSREADSGGLAYWHSELLSGKSRLQVLAGFIESNEFAALCSEYGIEVGVINY